MAMLLKKGHFGRSFLQGPNKISKINLYTEFSSLMCALPASLKVSQIVFTMFTAVQLGNDVHPPERTCNLAQDGSFISMISHVVSGNE